MNAKPIIALPELQNWDKGPNGTGKDLPKLQKCWEDSYQRGQICIDMWTFMCYDWNRKAYGRWSATELKERIGFLKGFLKGVWLGGERKSVEIAVVTHILFLPK
jgi:hypothetical protein